MAAEPDARAPGNPLRDPSTPAVYEASAADWARRRRPAAVDEASALAVEALDRGPVLDLGCGPGWHLGALGPRAVALDASAAMLALAGAAAPGAGRVRADLHALPLRPGCGAAAWARHSYVHLARTRLPAALADLHRVLAVGAPVALTLFGGDQEHGPLPADDFPGRRFALWPADLAADVLAGAGFEGAVESRHGPDGHEVLHLRARRAHTLADSVGPGLAVLVCGLNPSPRAAATGVPYAGPGNRFWPAAQRAGLVEQPRDVAAALAAGVGFTDLAKRTTPGADAVTAEEYRAGFARLERLVAWLRPRVVCFVGLDGWRRARDRSARPGPVAAGFAGRPAVLVASTSARNARTSLDALVDAFAHVRDLAATTPAPPGVGGAQRSRRSRRQVAKATSPTHDTAATTSEPT